MERTYWPRVKEANWTRCTRSLKRKQRSPGSKCVWQHRVIILNVSPFTSDFDKDACVSWRTQPKHKCVDPLERHSSLVCWTQAHNSKTKQSIDSKHTPRTALSPHGTRERPVLWFSSRTETVIIKTPQSQFKFCPHSMQTQKHAFLSVPNCGFSTNEGQISRDRLVLWKSSQNMAQKHLYTAASC